MDMQASDGISLEAQQGVNRLSRSQRHFCEIYETYFKDGSKELVAIREAIRLDAAATATPVASPTITTRPAASSSDR